MVAQIPADAQPVGGGAHEEAFRANALEEHDELEAKEDHGIDRWASNARVPILDQVTDEREIEHLVQMAVEVLRCPSWRFPFRFRRGSATIRGTLPLERHSFKQRTVFLAYPKR